MRCICSHTFEEHGDRAIAPCIGDHHEIQPRYWFDLNGYQAPPVCPCSGFRLAKLQDA